MAARSRFAVLLAVVMWGGTACPPPIDPGPGEATVDQSHLPVAPFDGLISSSAYCRRSPAGDPDSQQLAQTFTAGRSGQLTQVSLITHPGPDNSQEIDELHVYLEGVTPEGLPNNSIIASAYFLGPGSPNSTTFVDIPFNNPATLTAGTKYAIVLAVECPGNGMINNWNAYAYYGPRDPYPAGNYAAQSPTFNGGQWVSGDFPDLDIDNYFKTWVR